MPLADDRAILRRPIGFAVGVNREEEIDPAEQRERLPGLLRFVRTFAGELLEKEFGTTIEGYPDAARRETHDLRVRLRDQRAASAPARALLTVLIDLMDVEIDHEEASPENDPEEQEDFHDAVLTEDVPLVVELLDDGPVGGGQAVTSVAASSAVGEGTLAVRSRSTATASLARSR